MGAVSLGVASLGAVFPCWENKGGDEEVMDGGRWKRVRDFQV